MPDFEQIGTVEILRSRVYNLDPYWTDEIATQVVVDAGTYPLMYDGYSHVWLLTGLLNGNFLRRGDGLMLGYGGDKPLVGLEVTFPTKLFGPDQWKELLAHETAIEGHPEQRLRITIGGVNE